MILRDVKQRSEWFQLIPNNLECKLIQNGCVFMPNINLIFAKFYILLCLHNLWFVIIVHQAFYLVCSFKLCVKFIINLFSKAIFKEELSGKFGICLFLTVKNKLYKLCLSLHGRPYYNLKIVAIKQIKKFKYLYIF